MAAIASREPLWLLMQPGDDHTETVVLYALAHEAGLSWRGGWMARRHALFKAEDRRGGRQDPTLLQTIARKLGLDRHVVGSAVRSLLARGLVMWRGRRLEPTYNALQARWRVSKPAHRVKVPWTVLADRRCNLTDALVVGKIAKVYGLLGNRWWPTTRSLASDLMRSFRTIARSTSKLLALGAVALFVRTRRGRYLTLSSSSPESSDDLRVIPTREALREILGGLMAETKPPPGQGAGRTYDPEDFLRRCRALKESAAPKPSSRLQAKAERARLRAEAAARGEVLQSRYPVSLAGNPNEHPLESLRRRDAGATT